MRSITSSEPIEYTNNEALIISFLLTLFITGIFAFVGFAYPTSRLLPAKYYKIKNPRIITAIGKALGIKYFQFFLLFAYWGRGKNRKKYFNGTKKGLTNFIFQTKQSEFGHLGAFVAISASSLILVLYGHYSIVIIMTLINIIGNAYPIILQRTHRMRIEKITQTHS